MTDLERSWDDLPVDSVPLDAILSEGRREAARSQRQRPEARLRRSLLGVAAIGGIAAAFVAGTLVTTPDTGSPSDAPFGAAAPGEPAAPGELAPGVVPAAFQGELQAPKSCDDLLATYVDAGVDLVSAYGWGSPYGGVAYDAGMVRRNSLPMGFSHQVADFAASADLAGNVRGQASTSTVTSSDTGTNVQEVGVDEPDLVKTDGSMLVRLQEHTLTTYDVSGTAVKETGSLDLGDFHDGEILLAGDTVVAIGDDGTRAREVSYGYGYYPGGTEQAPQTRVVTIDVADPAAPEIVQTVDYTAATVTARQHGDAIRLVLSAGLPDLDFVRPGRGRGSARTALEANRATVESSTLDDWLPRVSIDGGAPKQFLDCDRVAIPRAEIGLGTMAVVGFSARTPVAEVGDLSSLGLAGSAPLAYESADHLYLAASPPAGFGCFDCFVRAVDDSSRVDTGTTHVYDFALDGASASYVGAGDVEGTVADRWAMDEHDGVLRLAVGPSSETGRFNSIVTLRADGDELTEIGRLDRIGVGEDIKSVRWFDGLALLVTFRQTDPFYAVDLTDQQDPTLIGELKLPGFSSYLHPLGEMRVVGIGEGPQGDGRRWGAQAGLFDVTDLTKPGRISTVEYGGGTRALAGDDPRQFTWLPGTRTVLTVIQRGRAGYVSAMHVGGGRLANTMTQVEYGNDIAQVRLVPLPDDKVALVTGDDVKFFAPDPR